MVKKEYVVSNSIGFFGILTIAFIILKLTNVIAWKWIWVLLPLWGPTVFTIAISIILILMGTTLNVLSNIKRRK